MVVLIIIVSLCSAQVINIRGIVKDSAGVGISGATVKLEKAKFSTTTSNDGSFILTNPTVIKSVGSVLTMGTPQICLQNGKLKISLSNNTPVSVSVYDVGGRLVFNNKRVLNAGTNVIAPSLHASGIYLYRITIGLSVYLFRSTPVGAFSEKPDFVTGSSAPTTLAKISAIISDVISVTKEGLINYRDTIMKSDTSGIIIRMFPNAGNVTDADGNVYQSVRIGNMVWTVENIRTTKYNDGTVIPFVSDSVGWTKLTTPGYCFYNNITDTLYRKTWGALYNWYAVKTGKLAPEGWRVPTNDDWDGLSAYLGVGTEAKKMRETGILHWAPPNTDATNLSGFSGLPGGYRGSNGNFSFQKTHGCWWSATAYDSSLIYMRSLSSLLSRALTDKSEGCSVRLIRYFNLNDIHFITYDGNGNTGGSAPNEQNKVKGQPLTLSENSGNLTKTGYNFVGWNTSPDGSSTDYAAGLYYTAETTLKLYAKWFPVNSNSWIVTENHLTDPDGNAYTTVTIGTQVWTVENLKTTKYNDGVAIPNVTDSAQWVNLSTPGCCWYYNRLSDKATYGVLYNWYVVNTGKLAPAGWHVPTEGDWNKLSTYLGGATLAGGKMKVTGTYYWGKPNIGATNSSGFSGLPGGFRFDWGGFNDEGYFGDWWSSSKISASDAVAGELCTDDEDLGIRSFNRCWGLSVRLIKD